MNLRSAYGLRIPHFIISVSWSVGLTLTRSWTWLSLVLPWSWSWLYLDPSQSWSFLHFSTLMTWPWFRRSCFLDYNTAYYTKKQRHNLHRLLQSEKVLSQIYLYEQTVHISTMWTLFIIPSAVPGSKHLVEKNSDRGTVSFFPKVSCQNLHMPCFYSSSWSPADNVWSRERWKTDDLLWDFSDRC